MICALGPLCLQGVLAELQDAGCLEVSWHSRHSRHKQAQHGRHSGRRSGGSHGYSAGCQDAAGCSSGGCWLLRCGHPRVGCCYLSWEPHRLLSLPWRQVDEETGAVQPLAMGRIASFYYMRHQTMATFAQALGPGMDVQVHRGVCWILRAHCSVCIRILQLLERSRAWMGRWVLEWVFHAWAAGRGTNNTT